MPISALAGLVFGIAVISIGLYHVTIVDPRLRSLTSKLADENEGGAVPDLDSLAALRSAQAMASKQTDGRFEEIERTISRDVHRVGFVRYNAFDDVGSDQSFTLALLNGEGDGVVVTSIFSRTETRTFGKAVRRYVPQQGASKEEQSAIAMARGGVGV
jgi:hypothetical protein